MKNPIQQVAICEGGPAYFVGSGNGVARQCVAQRRGRSLVEENPHWVRGGLLAPTGGRQALLGVVQNRLNLFAGHAGKPLQEIIHPRPTFQVLKQRFDRHPCAFENPGAAHLFRRPLNHRTLTSIKAWSKVTS
jgi:hypothetical protein